MCFYTAAAASTSENFLGMSLLGPNPRTTDSETVLQTALPVILLCSHFETVDIDKSSSVIQIVDSRVFCGKPSFKKNDSMTKDASHTHSSDLLKMSAILR